MTIEQYRKSQQVTVRPSRTELELRRLLRHENIKDMDPKEIALLQEEFYYLTRSKAQQLEQLQEINHYYGPFTHCTSTQKSALIDKQGLKPRGERASIYKGHLESLTDRVYLSTFHPHADPERGVYRCMDSIERSCRKAGEEPWLNGYVYVLDEIPEQYYNKIGFDEDAFSSDPWYEEEEEGRPIIRDLVWGISSANSLGIKATIPRRYLRKLSAREFFEQYVRDTYYGRGYSWEEFLERKRKEREVRHDL
jgi:hypothetical protein